LTKADYCAKTGQFKRNGMPTGTVNVQGYVVVRHEKMLRLAHRLAWFLHYGEWPPGIIDHIDGDRTNNRICNLRVATPRQNATNARQKCSADAPYKGITWDKSKKKWAAQIRVAGKNKLIGRFDTPEAAHKAYSDAAHKHHGEYARTC